VLQSSSDHNREVSGQMIVLNRITERAHGIPLPRQEEKILVLNYPSFYTHFPMYLNITVMVNCKYVTITTTKAHLPVYFFARRTHGSMRALGILIVQELMHKKMS
jgi:hypothetical protein